MKKSIGSPRAQRGMSMTALLLITSVALFIGLFVAKAGPAYFENWTVTKIADGVAADSELLRAPRSRIFQSIQEQYRHNNLWDLKAEETITLKKDAERGYLVTVNYEKRENLFSNIDLVMRFDKQAGVL